MQCRDITALPQYTPTDPHFLWANIQLEKGSFSKDRLATLTIGDAKEQLYYRTCPCKGVKVCPIDGCSYTVTMKAKKPCPKHVKHDLQPVTTCSVEFIYLYPPIIQEQIIDDELVAYQGTGMKVKDARILCIDIQFQAPQKSPPILRRKFRQLPEWTTDLQLHRFNRERSRLCPCFS